MLVLAAADPMSVVHRILVICSFVCSTLVIAAFAFFAADQIAGASKQQVAALASGAPTRPSVSIVHTRHGQPRTFIEGAAKALTYPFRSLMNSSSAWARQLFLLVCGLALYGVGLGYVARYADGLP
jgi:hypothetical protein